MKIIHADISHIDQVVDLFDAYRVWYRKESNKEMARNFLLQRMRNGESIIYVCENVNGQLIGFTQLYPIFSSVRMKRMWLLNDLFVDPDFRGKGISKMLIDQAKELCKKTNACGILLETETTNDIGNKLYPATGFELEENNFYFWTNS
jgi:GNAT superfamily N-acetyltransferase